MKSEGQIQQFTGIDDPYEPPETPELTIDTERQSIDESLQEVLQAVHRYIE